MSAASNSCSNGKGLLVIGAGLGRTGTDSLREALQILLGSPCYHMLDIISIGDSELALWTEQTTPEWKTIFDERPDGTQYLAAVDYPVCVYVEELMKLYPKALVILSKRKSADEWAKSAESTIIHASKIVFWVNLLTFDLLPSASMFAKLTKNMYRNTLGYEPRHCNRQRLISGYEEHNARIEKVVPKERLLVYTVGEGWEPLCKALNVPIPNVPYPNKNNTQAFLQRFQQEVRNKLPRQLMTFRGFLVLALYVTAGAATYFGGKLLVQQFYTPNNGSNSLPFKLPALNFLGLK